MADGLKKAAVWLGLMSDTAYSADEDTNERTERVESSTPDSSSPREGRSATAATVADEPSASITALETRRPSAAPTSVPQPAPKAPERQSQPQAADLSRIITVHPRTYNEARTIGEHFRDGVPVIMNLSEMEDSDAKRLVDFSAGLIFGLRGAIERITSKVFLLSPNNVHVTAEDKERIAGGFFNQS
ncbi:cell division protein SepF [Nigerium massiliense]|uniref:cell division protein SepF n=1 Tax=Nigerium massiliense TaxID=1522317 RepID=UPI000591386E|nr:cell division protein SepF [Nigerium massiliense]